ncbi:methyltransferase domain-containing protein [Pontiellaceae bacterium B12227]|nr:methyltransferase domain-containing protein [Pontiellaceae bacterium B12227]
MRETNNNRDTGVRVWQEKLLDRSIRRSRKLKRLKEAVGSSLNLQCLEISEGDGTISAQLRTLGGSWKTAPVSKEAADSISYSLSETLVPLENEKLPFEDHTFDRLIIVDALKRFDDDYEFLHECHRVLKNDGWLIIAEARRVPISLTSLLQHLFRLTPANQGAWRNGYKQQELFDKLKDGYDVPEIGVYSNGLLESTATFGEAIQKMFTPLPYWLMQEQLPQSEFKRFQRLQALGSAAYPLLWLLAQFEFIPGHKLLVRSRRRHWRPRLQPKLIDGRSIAEAAINTKIGTAAPF